MSVPLPPRPTGCESCLSISAMRKLNCEPFFFIFYFFIGPKMLWYPFFAKWLSKPLFKSLRFPIFTLGWEIDWDEGRRIVPLFWVFRVVWCEAFVFVWKFQIKEEINQMWWSMIRVFKIILTITLLWYEIKYTVIEDFCHIAHP